MTTIHLGVEGEYGRRLARYLEVHMERSVRIRYFTQPNQWAATENPDGLSVLDRSFFQGLPEDTKESLLNSDILWITDDEEEDGYCRFHPPEELKSMLVKRCCGGSRTANDEAGPSFTALFSPLEDPLFYDLVRSYIREGDLYLGMEDLGGKSPAGDSFLGEGRNHMGDLSYYIHLRDSEIMSRVKELSVRSEGYDILPAPPVFLPLLELSPEDYRWFFDQLRESKAYAHVYVGIGCGLLGFAGILSCFDRVICLSSRENRRVAGGCDHVARSLKAGYENFSGSCSLVFREDIQQG